MDQQRLIELNQELCKTAFAAKPVLTRLLSALRAPGRLTERGLQAWQGVAAKYPRAAGRAEGASVPLSGLGLYSLFKSKPLEGAGEWLGDAATGIFGGVNTQPELGKLLKERTKRYGEIERTGLSLQKSSNALVNAATDYVSNGVANQALNPRSTSRVMAGLMTRGVRLAGNQLFGQNQPKPMAATPAVQPPRLR